MKYAEPKEVDYPGCYDPEGEALLGFVTERIGRQNTFGDAVYNLVRALVPDAPVYHLTILMTTREHWSGYSEYTITNTWSEIILSVPELEWEKEWSSLGEFLRALADANPDKGH